MLPPQTYLRILFCLGPSGSGFDLQLRSIFAKNIYKNIKVHINPWRKARHKPQTSKSNNNIYRKKSPELNQIDTSKPLEYLYSCLYSFMSLLVTDFCRTDLSGCSFSHKSQVLAHYFRTNDHRSTCFVIKQLTQI